MTDDEFLEAFEGCRMPADVWTHEAHIRMAWLYLRARPLDEVIPVVTDVLRRFAASRGRAEAYHETITVASLTLIDARIARRPGPGGYPGFVGENPDLLDRTLGFLREHYSSQVLDSSEARSMFVGPDRAPLPPARCGRGGGPDG